AAGAWAGEITRQFGEPVPMFAAGPPLFTITPENTYAGPSLHAVDGTLLLRPGRNGEAVAGSFPRVRADVATGTAIVPGHRVYRGVSIGILMLDTRFERFNGDIGNARTWPFPVQYRVVRGATPNRVTRPEGPDMLDAFKAAADEMIDAGVDGITTTCGFLALYQRELADYCSVPVATSALLQVPMVARILPRGKRPAILTFSAESLTSRHL